MTTPATGRELTSACNGVTTVFNCPVFVGGSAFLKVYLLTSADQDNADGTLLAEGADYTIAGDGRTGTAQITTAIAQPPGKWIRRWRRSSRAQGNDYVANDGFPADSHELALDRLSLVDEELDDDIADVTVDLADLEARALRGPAGDTIGELPAAGGRGDMFMRFAPNGLTVLMQSASHLALAIAAPLISLLGSAFKGDPGSPGEGYATRAAMALAGDTAANLDDAWLTEGVRGGKFVFYTVIAFELNYGFALTDLVTADPDQIIAVAKQSDATGAGGAWVRQTAEITPFMAGAVTYDPGNEVWVHDELNAFFRLARNEKIARRYVFSWEGEWGVAETIIAAFWNGAEPNVERRFRMGTLRVAPLAELPGGVPLDVVLDIAGLRCRWDGACGIHKSGATYYADPYATRRFKAGARLRFTSGSTFGDFYVDDAKRDCVWLTSAEAGGFVLDGIAFPNATNIASKIGRIFSRTSGSNYRYSEATPLVASAREQGTVTGGTPFSGVEAFTPDPGLGGYGSYYQQTRLTVPSTADLEIFDLIWGRVELTPAIYGTIAADNATSKIIWSAGDPTAFNGAGNGLQVGDIYPPFQGGVNAGVEFRIVSFGGVSNREIVVAPAPATHAASADAAYTQYGKKSWHWVAHVEDATHFMAFPWVPDRINSSFHIVHGACLRTDGDDGGLVSVAGVIALLMAISYWGKGLYAPKIGTVLAESTNIGIRLSDPIDSPHIGLSIEHGHVGIADGCDVSILSGSVNCYGSINMQSTFDLGRCVASGPRTDLNTESPYPFQLGYLQIFQQGGALLETGAQTTNEGSQWAFYGISNAQRYREVFIHADTETLTVRFDRDEARLIPKHHWATIIWTDADGSAPDGTLTLNLDPVLASLGWTFAGAGAGAAYAIVTPGTSVRLELQFLPATKKVAITRFNGA